MKILETDRLTLRELDLEDAAFILELVNEPGWRRFIGDRGIKTLAAAQGYVQQGPMEMYGKGRWKCMPGSGSGCGW